MSDTNPTLADLFTDVPSDLTNYFGDVGDGSYGTRARRAKSRIQEEEPEQGAQRDVVDGAR